MGSRRIWMATRVPATRSLLVNQRAFSYLYPDLGNVQHRFNEFQEFSLSCGQPIGAVLITKREVCRLCKKVLSINRNSHVVVAYHEQRGAHLATRVTKCCRVCKVYKHCGFWTQGGKRQFNKDCVQNEFLMSSEDTTFAISLLRQLPIYRSLVQYLSLPSPWLSTESSVIIKHRLEPSPLGKKKEDQKDLL